MSMMIALLLPMFNDTVSDNATTMPLEPIKTATEPATTLRSKAPGSVPPGGYWRFRDPDLPDAPPIAHPYYTQVKARAHAQRVAANLPIPIQWDDWFDMQVCQGTPQGCFEVPATPAEPEESSWLKLAAQFTFAMVAWAKQGFPITPWEVYRARHETCAGSSTTPRCQRFSYFTGTGLAKCGACGCSMLKLYLRTSKCPLNKWKA